MIEIDPDFLQISRWTFDNLAITIQQPFCDLFAADQMMEAAVSVMNTVDAEVNTTKSIKTWASGELMFYLPSNNCSADVIRL